MNSDVAIAPSVKCRQCGYDLRGLDPDGRCPECGMLVAFSLRDDTLACSQPAFVRSLAGGMLLLLANIFAPIALVIVSIVVPALELFGVVLPLIGLYGAWLLTTPDPSGLGEEEYGRWRQRTRLVAVIGMSADTLVPFLRLLFLALPLSLLESGIELVVGAAYVLMLLYLERLAERISDRFEGRKLSRRAVGLRWLTIAVFSFSALRLLLPWLGTGGMNPNAGPLGPVLLIAAVLGSVLRIWMAVGWLMLMVGFRKALAEETKEAESRWVPEQTG